MIFQPLVLVARLSTVGARAQHVGRVLPTLQPPPGDDAAYLEGLEEVEHALGLELAVGGQELHLQAFARARWAEVDRALNGAVIMAPTLKRSSYLTA